MLGGMGPTDGRPQSGEAVAVADVRHGNAPTTGQQIGAGTALLIIDLMVIAWLVFAYGMAGWADGYDSGNTPSAPGQASQGMWILISGAVVTGGALLALRWRITALVQLIVLGTGAALLAGFATPP